MLEKVNNCPVCGHDKFENYLICQDHFYTKESFAIMRCNQCSLLLTNPRPAKSRLIQYYKSDAYISHSDKAINLTQHIYKIVRNYTLKQKLKLINSLSDQKEILDIGCGTGDFLLHCKKNEWNVHGCEPDTAAREMAEDKIKIDLFKSIEDVRKLNRIPVITLWHVLEHLPNINETIEIIHSILPTNGNLIVAVPNQESYDQQIYKEHWAAYDVPRHLYHFTQKTIGQLFIKHKLKIKYVLPMKFDSYYVSLLSELYKNGKQNYLRSFINGYKSNTYASKNKNNYSSLIYIIRK